MTEASYALSAERKEMDNAHHERVYRLLFETGGVTPGVVPRDTVIAAYSAVLIKDIPWSVNELLIYKQNEVHR
jgi:hypothetical protein